MEFNFSQYDKTLFSIRQDVFRPFGKQKIPISLGDQDFTVFCFF